VSVLALTGVGCGGGGDEDSAPDAGTPSSLDSSAGPSRGGSTPATGSSLGPVDDGAGTVACNEAIGELSSLPSEYTVVADSVALPRRMPLQAERNTTVPASDPAAYFAKYGLVVHVGVAVDLTVAPSSADDAAMGWGRGDPGPAVQVPACSAHKDGSAWLAFAGGYYASTPRCVPIEVRTPSGTESVGVGVGVTCPGQPAAQPAG